MDLDEGAGERPDPVGQVRGDVADEQSPDRGVQGRLDEEPHETDTDDNPREGEGEKAQGFEKAGGLRADLDDNVGDEEGKDHPQRRPADAEVEAVPQG